MRTHVQLPQMIASHVVLARKLTTLEKKYDIQFKAVFDAVCELMAPLEPKSKRPIGFAPWEKNDADPFGFWCFCGGVYVNR